MSRIENDAFFTPDNVALACVEDFYNELPEYKNHEIVEPSAGGGAFLRAFEKLGLKYEAYDLNPQAENIIQADYLSTELDLSGKVVLGNPPYGYRNKLTKSFIKRSFKQGAEAVGFLLFGNILNHYFLNQIGYEIVYYKRITDFCFLDSGGNTVFNTSEGHIKPVFVVWKKDNLQKIKKSVIEYGTKENWSWFANKSGIKKRQFETVNLYPNHGITYWIVSSDPKRVSLILNTSHDFKSFMYEGLMWMVLSGRVKPDTVNFYASYPELNRGWIDIDY